MARSSTRILQNIELGIDESLEKHLDQLMPGHGPFRILRQSVDARRRHAPHFVYTVEVAAAGETLDNPDFKIESLPENTKKKLKHRPIIVGSGPAGLFAALRLVEHGIPCLLLERGSEAAGRIKGINKYWRYGVLDRRNNVCYGEGGAGLYSDGKLITRIKSPYIPYVLQRLVQFGAPSEIQYLSNPHVGSDKIRRVIPKMREFLLAHGCEIKYDCQVTEILTKDKAITGVRTEHGETFPTDHIVLATGHSAEDMLYHLRDIGVHVEGKSFAMGLRIEHPQGDINKIQYRDFHDHPKLGSANYRLTYHDDETEIGVYSFCMCPGGYVLSSGTEQDGIVCNGMSNFHRNSPYANAALVVSVHHAENFGNDIFGGLKLRRKLETEAFQAVQNAGGTKQLPAQRLEDFVAGKQSRGAIVGSSPSGASNVRLDELLPSWMRDKLKEGLSNFEKNMRGFMSPAATFYGVESRTSCPVRVTRDDKTLQSISHSGLYPCGEGAGYAGGITSAACDGIKVVEEIIKTLM